MGIGVNGVGREMLSGLSGSLLRKSLVFSLPLDRISLDMIEQCVGGRVPKVV